MLHKHTQIATKINHILLDFAVVSGQVWVPRGDVQLDLLILAVDATAAHKVRSGSRMLEAVLDSGEVGDADDAATIAAST